jgi:hypothetical protein
LHLWQTEVTQKAADQLRKKLPQLMVTGFPEPPVNSSPIQSPAKKDNAEAIEEEPATDASDANEQTSEKKPAESKRAKE